MTLLNEIHPVCPGCGRNLPFRWDASLPLNERRVYMPPEWAGLYQTCPACRDIDVIVTLPELPCRPTVFIETQTDIPFPSGTTGAHQPEGTPGAAFCPSPAAPDTIKETP